MPPLVWTESFSSQVVGGGVRLRGSGSCRPILPVRAIGCASVKRAMQPDPIVEVHVAGHALGVADGLVGRR